MMLIALLPLLVFGAHAAPVPSLPRGQLMAAAGKIDITPDPHASAVWLAGYGASGRRADGVHQPLHARAIVITDGTKKVALVSVDSIGLFREDVLEWRRALGWNDGDRYLFVGATHSHSTPDTMGLWGRFPGASGVDPGYRSRVRNAVVDLVNELSAKMYPVEVVAAKTELEPTGLCLDDRDPVAIDPELDAIHFRVKGSRNPLATLVRWSCHPVVLTEANRKISPDFPGPLCDRVESGGGGACVYFSGSLGGHLIPATDRKAALGQQYDDARRIGERIADAALASIKKAEPVKGAVDFSSAAVRLPVENSRYLAFLPSLAFGHKLLGPEGGALPAWKAYWLPLKHLVRFPLRPAELPWVETEVSRIKIGSVQVLGVPAEIFPEMVVGGFDGSRRYGHPLVGPGNPNPPDLARAPKGPYLRERLGRRGVVIGLANDELGYLVPEYDFKASSTRTMLPQPPGTHYEETNSIGPSATAILLGAFDEILK